MGGAITGELLRYYTVCLLQKLPQWEELALANG